MTITAIEQAKKREERVNIFLDDEFWIGLDKNQLIQFGLHKGKTITAEEKKIIEEDSIFYKLVEKTINLTFIRPRSKLEVLQYLTLKKEVEDLMANKVIEYLESKSFLSDEKFTEWYINNRVSQGFHGRNKIYAELLKKGVNRSIINQYLKESEENNNNTEKIQQLYNKIKNQVKVKTPMERKNKIYQRILGRGYTYSEIDKALKELINS